jgi:hypothetical protein
VRRAILRRLALVVLGVVVSLAAAEAGLRLYQALDPSFVFPDTSYNRFRGQPRSRDYDFQLNTRGFKDREFAEEKAPGTFRILGIGDSFAFGVVPYRHNYLTLLEATLDRPGRPVEVINMGIPGLFPRDYLAVLVDEGLALRPDMVIVSFFVGNDFPETVGQPLHTHSYLASLVVFLRALGRTHEGLVIHRRPTYDDEAPTFSDEAFLEIERGRAAIFDLARPDFAARLAAAVDPLRHIQQIGERRGIELLVVIIPDELQVSPALQAAVIAGPGGRPASLDFARPSHALRDALRARGIDVLDLLEPFRLAAGRRRLYKPNDTHWNIAGNELAAGLIARHLAERPLRPRTE